jgi:hypothetical protein
MQHRTPLKIKELWDCRRNQEVWKLIAGIDEQVAAWLMLQVEKCGWTNNSTVLQPDATF